MNAIKYAALALALLFISGLKAQTENPRIENGLSWYTDLTIAQDTSAATGKPIFALFTGSDWCGWCKRLQKAVFAKQEFIDWAKKNVVLLELDFPRTKQLSPELKAQNEGLLRKFKVQGFPTVWIFYLNKDEKTNQIICTPLGSCGYPQNPEPGKEQVAFLKDANLILKNKK